MFKLRTFLNSSAQFIIVRNLGPLLTMCRLFYYILYELENLFTPHPMGLWLLTVLPWFQDNVVHVVF